MHESQPLTMEEKVLTVSQTMQRRMTGAVSLAMLLVSAAIPGQAATLEKLSLEEMSQRATLIFRGRISHCAGEARGAVIYTRCYANVAETWKGQAGSATSFLVLGGKARGLVQTFTGSPRITEGDEYVLFLWAGRSGALQVIGLSQGVFDLKPSAKGGTTAVRAASSEVMLDKQGREVRDETIVVEADELRSRVRSALAAEPK